MKTVIFIFLILIAILTIGCTPSYGQTPKMIVLHNKPVKIDTLKTEIIYYYHQFRVIINNKDSVIIKAGRNSRSIFISENDRKEVLKKLVK